MTNEYGIGGAVLGAATMLPATGALGLWLLGRTNLFVIYGLLTIVVLNLLISIALIARYVQNSKNK